MSLVRDIYGAIVSATVVGGLFLGPAVLGSLYSLVSPDLIQTLAVSEARPAVFQGAFEISTVEIEGEEDGTADVDVPGEPSDAEDGADEGDGGEDEPAGVEPATGTAPTGPPKASGKKRANPKAGNDTADASKAAAGKKKRKRSRRSCPESIDGVRELSNGLYEIDRALLNHYTSSVKRMNELGYSRANKDGDGKGWYISGFGCRDLLWHAGFRRRDIVLRVNGRKTNNVMQIILLYAKLKAQKRFEVEVLRKGRPVMLKYQVVKE